LGQVEKMDDTVFCSTIIPTIGRDLLNRAVESVLAQDFTRGDFEVIVVNDSGRSLAPADWLQSPRVRLVETQRCERSIARNTGAALARGKYLNFLDDDDWLLPGALDHWWRQVEQREAGLVYGGTQLVDRAGNPIISLVHDLPGNCFVQVMAGEWIPLQASLIKKDVFFAVGGFHPMVIGAEDIDLLRRLALVSNFSGTDTLVACVGMGVEESSTDYVRSIHVARWAREEILNKPGVWGRLQDGANSSYWRGRIVRTYLTSAVWNLTHKRLWTAVSRGIFAASGLVHAAGHMGRREFWAALLRQHESQAFLRGFEMANRPVERRNLDELERAQRSAQM
jgi:hypothetical protein